MRILIVDDEPFNLDILRIYLTSLNYQIAEAKTGEEARRSIKQNLPDVILLDVMLPDLSGFDLCKEILSEFDVPIIFLSAYAHKEAIRQGLDVGAFDYLTKPFNLDLIKEKIEQALNKHLQ